MKLRVLIVDDEPTARRRLNRFLQKVADVQVLVECADGVEAVAAIREHQPDVVFLDVQMPEMDGFEVVRVIGVEQMPVVIFVTAFEQFALQAFEAQALDYLLKPFGEERVQQALDRARALLQGRSNLTLQQQLAGLLRATAGRNQAPARLLVKSNDRTLLLKPREIDWVEADGDYVRLHVGPESHLMRATLAEMERRLEPEGFVRVHRSRLVNLDRVREFRPLFQGESVVVLKDGVRLNASQTGMKQLQERLGATG
jgi:two-component system, LytTR family, response regulator